MLEVLLQAMLRRSCGARETTGISPCANSIELSLLLPSGKLLKLLLKSSYVLLVVHLDCKLDSNKDFNVYNIF